MNEQPREVPVNEDSLSQESAILDIFEGMKNPNPKKVVKLARRLERESTTNVQKRLCRDIIAAPDPVKYMYECIDKIRDCSRIMQEFMDTGHHGMIFTGKGGNDVYPIRLSARENWLNEGKPWDPEQEMIIQHDAVDAFMAANDLGHFFGKVVLFPNFGFSGIPRIVEMRCGDTTGMKKYPGTKYYVRPGTDIQMTAPELDSAVEDIVADLRQVVKAKQKQINRPNH